MLLRACHVHLATLNGTDAICLSQISAIFPPASLMSTNSHASCSTDIGSVLERHRRADDVLVRRVAERAKELRLVVRVESLLRLPLRDTISVQLFGLRSMNIV